VIVDSVTESDIPIVPDNYILPTQTGYVVPHIISQNSVLTNMTAAPGVRKTEDLLLMLDAQIHSQLAATV